MASPGLSQQSVVTPNQPAQPEAAVADAIAAVRVARASLAALALKMGQTFEAKVVALAGNGLTTLSIGGQMLSVKLSTPLPVGTQVQVTVAPTPDGQMALKVVPMPLAPAPSTPLQPLPVTMPLVVPATITATRTATQMPVAGAEPATNMAQQPNMARADQPAVSSQTTATVEATPSQRTVATPGAMADPAQRALVGGQVQGPSQGPAMPMTTATPVSGQPARIPAAPAAQQIAVPSEVQARPLPTGMPQAPTQQSAAPSAPATPTTAVNPTTLAVILTGAAPSQLSTPGVQMAIPSTSAVTAPAASAPLAGGAPAAPAQAAMQPSATTAVPEAPLLAVMKTLQSGVMSAMPRPVVEAAIRLLAGRLALDGGPPSGETLKAAVQRAGIFLEAPSAARTLTPDMRAALVQFRSSLLGMLGGSEIAPVAPVTRRLEGMPPDQPERVMPLPPATDGGTAKDTARTLLNQTDGALGRLKVAQLSAQPADARGPAGQPAADFTVELPVVLGAETAMIQLKVDRDGRAKGRAGERGWRMRFAVRFSVLGEVGAQVSLLGKTMNVLVWAESEATADVLAEMLPELTPVLAAKGLEVQSVRLRRRAPEDVAPAAGGLVDSVG